MFFPYTRPISPTFLAAALLLVACATTDTRESAQEQLGASERTFSNFQNDPEMTWFRENVHKARAVVISPRVTRAGFVVGGSGGNAVVLARDGKSGRWAGPAFYRMAAGSVGLQIGGDVSEVIMLVMTENALDRLMSSSFKLGGDASVAAGPVGMGATGTVNADVVSFARSKGAFAGVSLEGLVISPDTGANTTYYGQEASPADILIRHSVSNPSSVPLQQALSRGAR